jgi:hypothetical protein
METLHEPTWYEKYLKEKHIVLLQILRSQAAALLGNPAHPHFTDHTLAHSDRVIDVIGRLLERQNNLNEDELFVLLAAAYLHDIGTQIKKSDLLRFPGLDNFLSKSNMTRAGLEAEKALLSFIRRWHHVFTYFMITELLRTYFGLDSSPYTEEIALVAQGHRKVELTSAEYRRRGAIRVDLLAAFLRLADELDCDRNRVDLRKMRVLDLSLDDKFYWFGHHCIDRVDIKNHYIKLYGRVPMGFKKEFKLLYIVPLWQRYMEVLGILQREDYVIAWAPSELAESRDMARLFEAEKGLLGYIKKEASDIEDILDVPGHLSLYDETSPENRVGEMEVSPFYFTSFDTFCGIKILNWPEKARCCQILLVDDPQKLRGASIPAEDPLWESAIIKRGDSASDWPQLAEKGEYGYLIIFYETEDAEFIYLTWRGKFFLLDERSNEVLRRLSQDILGYNKLSENEKKFLLGSLTARLGNYEAALKMLLPLIEIEANLYQETAALVVSIYRNIEKEMETMGWYDEAARIGSKISRLLVEISRSIPEG